MLTPAGVVALTTTAEAAQHNGSTLTATQFNAASSCARRRTVHWSLLSGLRMVNAYRGTTPGTPDGRNAVPVNPTFDHTFPSPGIHTRYGSVHAGRCKADPANIDAHIAACDTARVVASPSASPGVPASAPVVRRRRSRG